MKFALNWLLLALATLGSGCTSPDREQPSSARPASADPSKGSDEAAAATQAQPQGPAYLLRMVDYRSGARMELVNPSHTTALAQYSTVRADPSRKVTDEDWMLGLIDYMKDEGWSKEEKRGSAPTMARDSLRWSLELVGPEGTSFVAEPMDSKGAQRTRLRKLRDAFVATYNATSGFQAVRAQPGKLPFKVPDYPTAKQKGGR